MLILLLKCQTPFSRRTYPENLGQKYSQILKLHIDFVSTPNKSNPNGVKMGTYEAQLQFENT